MLCCKVGLPGIIFTIQSAVTLVDFKEHLAGISEKGTYIRAPSAVPPLELQKHFLASAETKDNSIKDTIPTEQAALVSPALASCGYRMPS